MSAFVAGAAIVGSAAISAYSSNQASKKASKANKANREASMEQFNKEHALAREQFKYQQRMDRENQRRLSRLDRITSQVSNQQLSDMRKGSQRADDMWSYYTNVGRPAINRTMNEANSWDSETTLQGLRGQANTDVERGIGQQRMALQRNMQRMGVNPASGRMMESLSDQGADAALMKVQAANSMTENRRTQGANMRVNSANMANGFAGQSVAQSGVSLGFGNAATGNAALSLNGGLNMQGQTTAGLQSAGGMMNRASGTLQSLNNSYMNGINTVNELNMATAGHVGDMFTGAAGAYGNNIKWNQYQSDRAKRGF